MKAQTAIAVAIAIGIMIAIAYWVFAPLMHVGDTTRGDIDAVVAAMHDQDVQGSRTLFREGVFSTAFERIDRHSPLQRKTYLADKQQQ